jgi:hypothetical protein
MGGIRKYFYREKIDLEILTDLHFFNLPGHENLVFDVPSACLPVWMYGCMCASRLHGYTDFTPIHFSRVYQSLGGAQQI